MKKSLLALAALAALSLTACDKAPPGWLPEPNKPAEQSNPNVLKNGQGIPGADDARPTHEVKDGGVNPGGFSHDVEVIQNADGTITIRPRAAANAAK